MTAVVTNTTNDQPVNIPLPVTGAGATLRIISQAANGALGLNTNTGVATYFPNPGFVGTDHFTFAAYDGAKNSNLATGIVKVAQGPFSLGAVAHVPLTYPAALPVAFTVVPSVTNSSAPVSFNWNFGDGSAHSTDQYAAHAYASAGTYHWTVISTLVTATATNSGSIVISNALQLSVALVGGRLTLSLPSTTADTLLEATSNLGPSAQWLWVTNSQTLPAADQRFFRLRRPW